MCTMKVWALAKSLKNPQSYDILCPYFIILSEHSRCQSDPGKWKVHANLLYRIVSYRKSDNQSDLPCICVYQIHRTNFTQQIRRWNRTNLAWWCQLHWLRDVHWWLSSRWLGYHWLYSQRGRVHSMQLCLNYNSYNYNAGASSPW